MENLATIKVKIDTQGRALIPKKTREELGLKSGDEIVGRLEAGTLVLEPRNVLLSRLQDKYAGDSSLVESLRDVRNEEAASE